MSKKILFLNPYPEDKAPSQRLKYEQYYSSIQDDGWTIEKESFINESFWSYIYQPGNTIKKMFATIKAYFRRLFVILFKVPKYDVVYIHLWVAPLGMPFLEFLTVLFARKIVYDIDDMVYIGHVSKANQLWIALKGRKKMIYLMKKANHVITCTPKLDQFVRQFNSNTTDISSTVDTDKRYLPRSDYSINNVPVIGWSGSVTTAKYLYLLEKPLQNLAKEIDFKLVVMGDKTFHIEGVNIEAMDWKEEIEMDVIKSFDIGVYPLPNEEWVYGKSGLKAIQYMALGIPTIATAIGANFRVIDNEQSGLLVEPDDYNGWEKALKMLLTNLELRQKLGHSGRKKVENEFSVSVNKLTYIEILNTV